MPLCLGPQCRQILFHESCPGLSGIRLALSIQLNGSIGVFDRFQCCRCQVAASWDDEIVGREAFYVVAIC